MSISIPRKGLPKQQLEKILKGVQITKADFMGQKYGQTSNTWNFLRFDNDEIYLPYWYARTLGYFPMEKPEISFSSSIEPRPYQVNKLDQAIDILIEHNVILLAMDPGFGKTACSVHLASGIGRVTLVIHPLKPLQKQWVGEFRKNTDAVIWEPGSKIDPVTADVLICSRGSIGKIPEEAMARVGTLIVDEMHMFYTEKSVDILLACQPEFVIACTATPEEEDGREKMLDLLVGKNAVTYHQEKDYTIIPIKTGYKVPHILDSRGSSDWVHMEEHIAEEPSRYALCMMLIHLVKMSDFKILILTKRDIQRNTLLELCEEDGISADVMTSTKHTYHDSDVLIMNVKKGGAGFDEANNCINFQGKLSRVLILFHSFKKWQMVCQAIGRLRVKDPIILDLIDNHRICENHFKSRCKLYRRCGTQNIPRPITFEDVKNKYQTMLDEEDDGDSMDDGNEEDDRVGGDESADEFEGYSTGDESADGDFEEDNVRVQRTRRTRRTQKTQRTQRNKLLPPTFRKNFRSG